MKDNHVDQTNHNFTIGYVEPRAISLNANPLKQESDLRNMFGGNDKSSVINAAIKTTFNVIDKFLLKIPLLT